MDYINKKKKKKEKKKDILWKKIKSQKPARSMRIKKVVIF